MIEEGLIKSEGGLLVIGGACPVRGWPYWTETGLARLNEDII